MRKPSTRPRDAGWGQLGGEAVHFTDREVKVADREDRGQVECKEVQRGLGSQDALEVSDGQERAREAC